MSTATVLEQLEAELAQAREVHERLVDFAGPGDTTVQPWVIALAAQRVTELELRLRYARDPEAHQPPATVKRTPKESLEVRKARIRASRERRLLAARDRVDAYKRTHPVNEHGVRTGPSVADNNWRHRQAHVDRELDSWATYQKDIQSIRHLTGLIEKEN